jgi:hypothetical protein
MQRYTDLQISFIHRMIAESIDPIDKISYLSTQNSLRTYWTPNFHISFCDVPSVRLPSEHTRVP